MNRQILIIAATLAISACDWLAPTGDSEVAESDSAASSSLDNAPQTGALAARAPQALTADDAPSAGEIPYGYTWAASFDPSGFFLPNSVISSGGWTIDHLFIPIDWEFAGWHIGGGAKDHLPIWLEIRPVDASTGTNELGGTSYEGAVRVRPDAFGLTDDGFTFYAAQSPAGAILISGRIDPQYLHTGDLPHDSAPALVGGLEMAGERQGDVSFMHWLGD